MAQIVYFCIFAAIVLTSLFQLTFGVKDDIPISCLPQDNVNLLADIPDPYVHETPTQTIRQILDDITRNQALELERVNEQQIEVVRQDEYLQQYGLYRTDIVGDGNCLFRAVSFGLYGTEDYHLSLRSLAVDHIEQNLHDFRFYFYNENEMPMSDLEIRNFLHSLRQPRTFAGQESIMALSRVLSVNILVTVGGDTQNPEVRTIEHNFENSPNIIHLVWTRPGGGHYEAVIESPSSSVAPKFRESSESASNKEISNYQWKFNAENCKPFSLNLLQNIKDKNIEMQENDHSYGVKQKLNVLNSECYKCKKKFFNKSTMMRHLKSYHQKGNEKKICCSISTCPLTFYNVEALVDHLRNFHGAEIEIENFRFDSLDSFEKFKELESMKTNTRFVKHRQNKLNKNGSQSFTLVCHRDGLKRDHLKKGKKYQGKRKANVKGSCKIEKLCPSRMSVSIKADGNVNVRYVKSHTHSTAFEESRFLPIPELIRSEICTMLSLKMPISNILDKIRENVCDRNHRHDLSNLKHYHLVDRKTIHNIKKTIVDSSITSHHDDATSTFLKVNELRKELYNPVLLYKQQNVDDLSTGLQKDDFMLALMTEKQKEMFEKFAPVILCMDSTHKTNIYSFKLITLLVLDEFRHGYPVAFCISNRESEDVISVFLNAVKERAPDTVVNVLMTDDDNAGWNAVKKVFGGHIRHFLCHWHVHESWKKKLRQLIKDENHQAEIYSYLCACLQAKTETLFEAYVQKLMTILQTTSPEFMHYFQNYYIDRKENWAKCFRTGEFGNVHTNMFVESFHNQLKTIYFEGKCNRRVDVLVETLLQIEKNLFMNHLRRLRFNLPSEENVNLSDRHQRSLEIDDKCILQVNENIFRFTSKDSTYTIERLADSCKEMYCFNKCKKLPCVKLCKHLFSCSCKDYSNGNVCKHLHKMHGFLYQNSHDNTTVDCHDDLNIEYKSGCNENETQCNSRDFTTHKINQIENRLKKISEQVKGDISVQEHRLDNILSALDHIIAANEGSCHIHKKIENFKKTDKISSNAKNILQPRFRPTVKKSGRNPKPKLRRPTEEEMQTLLPQELRSSQQSTTPAPTPEPSVAPYPPLRLVPGSTNTLPSPTPEGSVFSVGNGVGQPTWIRVPPAMLGRRIVTNINGKKQVIVFTRGEHKNDTADDHDM